MIKLVVADMDGTILQPDLSISSRTIAAIQALRAYGIRFTFATGRADQLMKEYVDQLALQDPIISSNGSVIGNPFSAERVFEQGLDKDVIEQALDYLEQHHVMYMIYTKDGILCRENERSRFFEARNLTLPQHQRTTFVYDDHPARLLQGQTVNKILIIEQDPTKYKRIHNWMRNLPNTNIIRSQSQFIDINPNGVNKGKALQQLAEYYKIELSDVVAFGDHHNDIEMIQTAGIGIAMGNAVDALKEIADDIALRNDEDGVAIWIETYLASL